MLTNNGLTKERTKTRKIGQLNKRQIATLNLDLNVDLDDEEGWGDDDRGRR